MSQYWPSPQSSLHRRFDAYDVVQKKPITVSVASQVIFLLLQWFQCTDKASGRMSTLSKNWYCWVSDAVFNICLLTRKCVPLFVECKLVTLPPHARRNKSPSPTRPLPRWFVDARKHIAMAPVLRADMGLRDTDNAASPYLDTTDTSYASSYYSDSYYSDSEPHESGCMFPCYNCGGEWPSHAALMAHVAASHEGCDRPRSRSRHSRAQSPHRSPSRPPGCWESPPSHTHRRRRSGKPKKISK